MVKFIFLPTTETSVERERRTEVGLDNQKKSLGKIANVDVSSRCAERSPPLSGEREKFVAVDLGILFDPRGSSYIATTTFSEPVHSAALRWRSILPAAKEEAHARRLRFAIYVGYASVFIDMLGAGVDGTIIPFLASELHAREQQVGYIFAAQSAAQMISMPIIGWLSDKVGRRPMLLIALLGNFTGFLMSGLAQSVEFLIGARIAAGAFGSSLPIVQAFIAESAPLEKRERCFANLNLFIASSMSIGPIVGAMLAELSLQAPMFFGAVLAAAGWVIAFFLFHVPRRPKHCSLVNTTTSTQDQTNAADHTHQVAAIGVMWTTAFLIMFALSSQISMGALYLNTLFGWSTLEIGALSSGGAVIGIFVQVAIFPRLIKWIGVPQTGAAGAVSLAIGLAAFAWIGTSSHTLFQEVSILCLSAAFNAAGQMFSFTAALLVLSIFTSAQSLGFVLSFLNSLQAFARVLGPIVWSHIYASISKTAPFWIASAVSMSTVLGFVIIMSLGASPRSESSSPLPARSCATFIPKQPSAAVLCTNHLWSAPTTSTSASTSTGGSAGAAGASDQINGSHTGGDTPLLSPLPLPPLLPPPPLLHLEPTYREIVQGKGASLTPAIRMAALSFYGHRPAHFPTARLLARRGSRQLAATRRLSLRALFTDRRNTVPSTLQARARSLMV